MESCGSCFEYFFACSSTVIQLETGLSAGTYQAWLKDRYNDYHVISSTVNANGDATLDLSAFDIAFSSHSGAFELTFRDSTVYGVDKQLAIDGNNYNCILLSFYEQS